MIQIFTDSNSTQQSQAIQIKQIINKREPLVKQIETVQNNLHFLN